MLKRGAARKVTVYLNEDTSGSEDFAYRQVLKFLLEQEVAGATLLRPEEGFGNHHQLHGATRKSFPIRIEFIDSPEVVDAILPSLCEIASDGGIAARTCI